MSKNTIQKKGFLTVEILIVASIMTISFLAITTVAQKSIQISHQSLHVLQASFLLEEGAEAVRILRDNAWSNINNGNYGLSFETPTTACPAPTCPTWKFLGNSEAIGSFTRKVNIADVNRDNTSYNIVTVGGANDPNTKLITITVSWQESGQSIDKNVSFYLTNIF
jgi:Tfp pilus assembly protein PilV